MEPKKILSKYNLHPIKRWGQNFLNNNQIVLQIINSFDLQPSDGILEIGSGLGIMTQALLEKSAKVVAVEIDKKLVAVLKSEFQIFKNLTIISDDFLNVNLKQLIEKEFQNFKRIHVVANLPYYLTSSILFKLLDFSYLFASFTLMMQKEVAQRIISLPNRRMYNNLSVVCQYYSNITIPVRVSSHNFFPQPKVDSWVVHFDLKRKYNVEHEQHFTQFVRKMFVKKRKILLNNLISVVKDKETAKNIIASLKWPSNIRSEQLEIHQFIELYQFVTNNVIISK